LLRLLPGKYTVTAELSGFSSVVLKDVELLVGNTLAIPFTMKLAQVSETLTVIGETPLVDTASSQVAGNVDRRQMEELPLQGRNWMELSKLVKGITANDVTNQPGVGKDDNFQLNLDGQQITQKIAGSGFGQPRFSRESIAEFQISALFDVTQGRSAGIEVHAITRSGTNKNSGSVYGFFRSDKFNAKDAVANKVLPYQNQQVGGASAARSSRTRCTTSRPTSTSANRGRFRRRPHLSGRWTSAADLRDTVQEQSEEPARRVDDQLSSKDRLTIRGSRWDWENPFVLGGRPPVELVGADEERHEHRRDLEQGDLGQQGVGTPVRLEQLRLDQQPAARARGHDPVRFQRPVSRQAVQLPAAVPPEQFESRYDLNWHHGSHDLKIGGEYLHVKHTGTWFIQRSAE
jgi:hypothetical protein